MRRLAVIPLLAVFALAGCTAPAEPISEAEFLTQARSLYTWADDATLLARGERLCDSLADQDGQDGRTSFAEYYIAQSDDEDGTGLEAGAFLQLSIDRFCPAMTVDI